ncbi:glycosyltransferase [Methylomonas sp. EFPC1]|uniref:glycosyltransferase n=1 Tax=Methylomonas sp. EFPC1 TaxID=2812647 RepID=UPI001967BB08|nr:glycosyltransferase [Methylomonas sp. EFPC1]QSB01062.1 glycosyltransferase [Methylomonas sp. EFPC1]
MKILMVHNRYQQVGGEDGVVAAEAELLMSHGDIVELWEVDNKNLPSNLLGKFKTALSTRYSRDSKLIALQRLKAFKPDIVHVHNFFPQISPSIYDACIQEAVPVVQTLHNYRLICPGAILMRGGKICEQCISGSPYQAVFYGCYRGSKMGSLVVAHMVSHHRNQGTWSNKVNKFIALTEFAKSKFVQAGFPVEKIAIKPNFIGDPYKVTAPMAKAKPGFALFVGRISDEKGIRTLVKAWSKLEGKCELKIAGSGPLEDSLQGIANITVLGRRSPSEVSVLMQQASFLVLPSEWYEGFPLVLVEALAHGLPVLASRLGSMLDIIEDGKTGLLFTPTDANDLADKAKWLVDHPKELERFSENARSVFNEKYTDEENYSALMKIYNSVL